MKLYSALLWFCLLTACKKEKITKQTVSVNGEGNPDKVNAFLQTTIQKDIYDDIAIYTMGSTYAVFFDSLQANVYNSNTYLDVGKVKINNVQLKPWPVAIAPPPFFAYGDTLNTMWWNGFINSSGGGKHWEIEGSPLFPKCEVWDYSKSPTYSNYEILPDTIYLSKENVIDVSGYENCTHVQVSITGAPGLGVYKIINPPTDKVKFTSSELSQLLPPSSISHELKLNFFRNTYKSTNGMIFLCQSNIVVKKHVVISF